MPTLAPKQKQVLDYIKQYTKKHGGSPSFMDMEKYLGKAFSTIHEHVRVLIKKGYLIKNDNEHRGTELNEEKKSVLQVPIMGNIAAGQPIEELAVPSGTITVSRDEVGTGKFFALRVAGNSMIEEGIFDGDTVVIRQQANAENGQMVVAIIDDGGATLKKLYRESNRFRLQPANQNMLPFYRTEVEIRGVVVKIDRNLTTQPDEIDYAAHRTRHRGWSDLRPFRRAARRGPRHRTAAP